jgi:tryptophan-rich sensory protein
MPIRSLHTLPLWVVLLACVGALGALASRDAASFYAQLARPAWAPPGWLFGPVWTALYALMAIAAWRVSRVPDRRGRPLTLFLLQLAANALWSWLFFAWHLGAAAFADVLVLDALVIATMAAFHRHDRIAALLLLPYLAWIAFATALTWSVWQRNPALLGG